MRLWTRRNVLAAGMLAPGAALTAAQGSRFDQVETPLTDELTGRGLTRLTDPRVLYHLPHYHHRFLATNNRFLLLGGEPDGTRQIHGLDLRRNRLTQMSEGEGTFPYSATLAQGGREIYYLQGDMLRSISLSGRGNRIVFRRPRGWLFTGHLSITDDAKTAAFVEINEDDLRDDPAEQFAARPQCRIRVVDLPTGKDRIVVRERAWLTHPQLRPGRRELLYAHEGPANEIEYRMYWTAIDGGKDKPIVPPNGGHVEREYWAADGSEVRFVHFPDETMRGATVRAISPETGEERRIARCSAFGWMQENIDGSAFVGASIRPSAPNIFVLFPLLDREITLCEHGASRKPYPIAGTDRIDYDCAMPQTAFSPDSQWVYFISDREGKPALYRMKVEDLVEAT